MTTINPEPIPEPRTTELIEKANLAALRMEEANKKHEELLMRQEQLAVERALGGKSEAGIPAEKPKEETPREYRDRIMKEGWPTT